MVHLLLSWGRTHALHFVLEISHSLTSQLSSCKQLSQLPTDDILKEMSDFLVTFATLEMKVDAEQKQSSEAVMKSGSNRDPDHYKRLLNQIYSPIDLNKIKSLKTKY